MRSTLSQLRRALSSPSSVATSCSLSRDLRINKGKVRRIIGALERAEIVFRVPPIGPGRRRVRRPWKVYFASSTLRWGQLMELLPGFPIRSTLLEEAVAARLRRMVLTTRRGDLVYGWKDGEVDLILEHERRLAFGVGLGKRSPMGQLSLARRLGVDNTYVVTLRAGVFEEKGAIQIPAWLLLF